METSSRFLSAMVRDVAAASRFSHRPVKPGPPRPSRAPRVSWRCRRKAPVMTFSSTVMSLMTWTIWKVRAMPSLQIRSAAEAGDVPLPRRGPVRRPGGRSP